MKIFKKVLNILVILTILLLIAGSIAIFINNNKTKEILDDYSSIYNNSKYSNKLLIEKIEPFKQDVSCGYAVIELFAKYTGNNEITEKYLYDKYGKVVTSTGKSFENEMNKLFTNYKTTMYKYLKSSELIDKVYDSLNNNIPVPIEWAAKNENEWTLHYSLVTGIDVVNDNITIVNPYGYEEIISIKEFINRISFEEYNNMPIFLKLGFAFNIFEKNTIFIIEKK